MEKKIAKLDLELKKYREQMKKMRDGPSKVKQPFFLSPSLYLHPSPPPLLPTEHGQAASTARLEAEEDV